MYEDFFGFTSKPFQLTPDPGFYFPSKAHNRALAYLKYGVNQGEGFIVITGDVGAGKTTVIRSLRQHLDESRLIVAHLQSPQADAEEILRMLATAFGLPAEGLSKSALLNSLETFLTAQARAGRRGLLIVDEAQNLAADALEELRMVSNFQDGQRSLLQTFLVGQPEFRTTMLGPGMQQLRDRVMASYHLGPLDAEDTHAYILHRLGIAGWHNDPVFDESAFAAIHRATGGIPRHINLLCNRLLLSAYLSEEHLVDADRVREVTAEQAREATQAGAGAGSGPQRGGGAGGGRAPGSPPPTRGERSLAARVTALESALLGVQHQLRKLAGGPRTAAHRVWARHLGRRRPH